MDDLELSSDDKDGLAKKKMVRVAVLFHVRKNFMGILTNQRESSRINEIYRINFFV